ncbi:hypothetical protein BV089_01769B, partial [Haemophilus influenzae]
QRRLQKLEFQHVILMVVNQKRKKIFLAQLKRLVFMIANYIPCKKNCPQQKIKSNKMRLQQESMLFLLNARIILNALIQSLHLRGLARWDKRFI